MPKTRQTPKKVPEEWNKGYNACKKQMLAKVNQLVARIERDINQRSGLSPMLWNDRHHHERIIEEWRILVEEELKKL